MVFSKRNTIKSEGLLEVRKSEKAAAIIFVHGLQGNPYKTWTKKGSKSLPHLFLEDKVYDNFDIFTFGYNTGFILKRQHFKEISDLLHSEVHAKLGNYNSIYFITHSMGGIVVQSMLTEQVEHKNKKLISAVCGIVYLAVPFLGSTIASAASATYMIFPPIIGERIISLQLRSLKVFSKDLAMVSEKWVRYRSDELEHLEELNLYGLSDKSVAKSSARAPYIKNSFAVSEGHISICKIDKKSTVYQIITNFYLGKDQETNINTLNDVQTEFSKYFQWLKYRTKEFIVPGVKVPLSIEHAWASLSVIEEPTDIANDSLEKEIAKYHEWERLSHSNQKKNAQEITELGQRVILIGGPGTGKSTLAMRTVYRLIIKGEKVLYVRLPYVAKEMEQGKSFEEALWSVALDSYAGDKKILRTGLDDVDALIADGLDECEPIRKRVSQSLYDWSIARKDTRVVITTRPVGYDSVQFKSFYHVEILPLDEKEISEYSLKLLQNFNDDNEKVEKLNSSFKKQLEDNKMAKLSARSPLLLNFLIQLLVSGKNFGKYRAELYSKILEEWIEQSDRVRGNKLSNQRAIRSIEWIGWVLQNVLDGKRGRSKKEMLQKLSPLIMEELDVRSLRATEIASECLDFWVDVGVLEHLKFGYEDGYTFIHLTFGEYAAGKYISGLPDERQRDLLLERMHIPIWRETFLLAGGTGSAYLFVNTILETMNGKHDLYSDIAFAAAILAEIDPITNLNKRVAEQAMHSISSPISMLCYEAGEALEGIAQQQPDWTFDFAKKLLHHHQNWTKLVAFKLAFMTNRFLIDCDDVLSLISMKKEESIDFEDFKAPFEWLIWNEVIILGMKQLLQPRTLDDEDLLKVVEALSEVNFSADFHIEFTKILQDLDRSDLLEILERRFKSNLNEFDYSKVSLKMLKGKQAFLGSILRQSSEKKEWSFNEEKPLIEISKIYNSMEIGKMPVYDLNPIIDEIQLPVVDEVIKGMLLVHEISKDDIYNEAQWVLNDAKDIKQSLSSIPDILEHEPNWENAKSILDKQLLIQSLSYPSKAIARNGSFLLIHCFKNTEIADEFKDAFMEAEGNSLFYYSRIAKVILKENALNATLERLNGGWSKGLQHLYSSLPNYQQAKNSELVCAALLSGINDTNQIIVKSAAEAMVKIEGVYDEDVLLEIATFWDENGAFCDCHETRIVGSSCPECHVVPNSPLPELITLLKKSKFFSFENRKHFSKHTRSDVQKAGSEGLAYYLSNHMKEIEKLVQEIENGKEPPVLLEAVFIVNYLMLKPISKELLSLIESDSFDVRIRLLKELSSSQWVDKSDAIPVVKQALVDGNSSVRDQAVIVYRSLELRE